MTESYLIEFYGDECPHCVKMRALTERLEKEKGVIVEEINMYEDMPARHVQELFDEVLYGDQPAGWGIAGTRENVRAMTRNDFVKYKKAHYVAKNTVIIVAGNVTKAEVDAEVKKYFSAIPISVKSKKIKTKIIQQKPKVLLKHKATDQTHFVLGVRSADMFSTANPTLTVLGSILGGGMSSRLFIKLREEMGVAYYVRAGNDASLDHGAFQVCAGVTNARTEEVLKEILKECTKLKDEKVTEKELAKVKSYLVGNMKLSLEATDDIANFYGLQEVLKGEVKMLDDKIKKIQAVTASDIQKMAKKIFTNKHLNLAVIGPFKDTARFEKLLKF